jgi:hypothetical protein
MDQRYPSIRKPIAVLPWLLFEHLSYPAIAFPDRDSLHNHCNAESTSSPHYYSFGLPAAIRDITLLYAMKTMSLCHSFLS